MNGPTREVRRRRVNITLTDETRHRLQSAFSARTWTELYGHMLQSAQQRDGKHRFPQGGLSIAHATIVYVYWLLEDCSTEKLAETFGVSQSSVSRLVNQMAEWVSPQKI